MKCGPDVHIHYRQLHMNLYKSASEPTIDHLHYSITAIRKMMNNLYVQTLHLISLTCLITANTSHVSLLYLYLRHRIYFHRSVPHTSHLNCLLILLIQLIVVEIGK